MSSRSNSQSVREKLGQWESKLAVLSEAQKDSYTTLSSLALSRPFPDSVSLVARET